MKQSKKLLKSKLLDKYPLIYGFTTKLAGDFRYDNLEKLGILFNINPKNIISMNQVHKKDIMLTKIKNRFLIVRTADCVPVLLFDPVKKIVAVCHAGWKGTYLKASKEVIKLMAKKGSDPSNIIAVLGPHIGPCCYNVPKERAIKFKYFLKKNNKYYLDLGRENIEILKSVGVKKIEDINICTSCQNELLFSYRYEGLNHGEQVGLIGMI